MIFKQVFQAGAISVCQVHACQIGDVSGVIAMLLLARKYGGDVVVPAACLGLFEYVQHLSALKALRVRRDVAEHLVEYFSDLHEHFVTPVRVRDGATL